MRGGEVLPSPWLFFRSSCRPAEAGELIVPRLRLRVVQATFPINKGGWEPTAHIRFRWAEDKASGFLRTLSLVLQARPLDHKPQVSSITPSPFPLAPRNRAPSSTIGRG